MQLAPKNPGKPASYTRTLLMHELSPFFRSHACVHFSSGDVGRHLRHSHPAVGAIP